MTRQSEHAHLLSGEVMHIKSGKALVCLVRSNSPLKRFLLGFTTASDELQTVPDGLIVVVPKFDFHFLFILPPPL